MSNLTFEKATKKKARARIAIQGPSGSGKTYTGLLLCKGLAGDGKVAVVDTESRSASKYADLFDFDVLELEDHHPERFVEAINLAAERGYSALLLDSISHEWNGTNGCMELVDKAKKRFGGNTHYAWAEVTPLHRKFIDAIVRAPLHIVGTMRSKAEWIQTEDSSGRTVVKKVGTAPVQREGMDFEFDVVAEMDLEHSFIVTKTRFPMLDGQVITKPDEELGDSVRAYLEEGEEDPRFEPASDETLQAIDDALTDLEAWNPERGEKARAHYKSEEKRAAEAREERAQEVLDRIRSAATAEKAEAEKKLQAENEKRQEATV